MTLYSEDRFRVRSTPRLHQFGLESTSGLFPGDCRVFPGEVGVVRVYCAKGWEGCQIIFSRGRTIEVGTRSLYKAKRRYRNGQPSGPWKYDLAILEHLAQVHERRPGWGREEEDE